MSRKEIHGIGDCLDPVNYVFHMQPALEWIISK